MQTIVSDIFEHFKFQLSVIVELQPFKDFTKFRKIENLIILVFETSFVLENTLILHYFEDMFGLESKSYVIL